MYDHVYVFVKGFCGSRVRGSEHLRTSERLGHLSQNRRKAAVEACRAFAPGQRIGRRHARKDAEPDELRPELLPNIDRLRGLILEVEKHFGDRVVRAPAHARGGVLVVRAAFRSGG